MVIPYSFDYNNCPPFVIGRWYNDIIFIKYAREQNYTVIDISSHKSYHQGESGVSQVVKVVEDHQFNKPYLYGNDPFNFVLRTDYSIC